MIKKWSTRAEDLAAADEILSNHMADHEKSELSLIDFDEAEALSSELMLAPEWLVELTDYFVEQYGADHGRFVTEKVLMNYMLSGQTLH